MVRLKFLIILAVLLLLGGCSIFNKNTLGKVSGSEMEMANQDVNTIEHNMTLYNYTGVTIDQVHLVSGSISGILASNIQPGSSVLAQWITTGQCPSDPEDFSSCESPYFVITVSGQKIPITVARLVSSELNEDPQEVLHLSFDEIAFFNTEDTYYFSPQPDYLDREVNSEENDVQVQYLYLPKVQRWLRQREGQLLFAVGLEEEEILAYFPNYAEDIPWVTCAAMISCETIYLEDVRVEIETENRIVTEIRESNKLQTFTPDDVIVIPVDHVRFPYLYFRYKDKAGDVHRQYVIDQQRDSNNGTIVSRMLTLNDKLYNVVPVG